MLVERMVSERGLRDVEGRPLREGRTPPELLKPDDIEYKPCPYTGSRSGKPMNASALRQMGAYWDEACELLASLRAAHDRVLGVTQPGLMDIWRVSQLGSALPWWHLFREGTVPAHVAALSKATLGQGIWAQRMLVRAIAEGWSPPPLTAESILALAEASGTLVGETEVCSGGDKMLLRFFDVLAGASAAAPAADELVAFGAHYAGFKLVMWIYFLARRFLWADAGAPLGEGVEPGDFFIVEPTDLRAVTPEQRAGWFRTLATLVVPFAPRGADVALRDHAFAIATAMGQGATFETLEAIFTSVIADVEVGFGGTPAITPEVLDRIVPRRHAELRGA
jgi:hypothetical protein